MYIYELKDSFHIIYSSSIKAKVSRQLREHSQNPAGEDSHPTGKHGTFCTGK